MDLLLVGKAVFYAGLVSGLLGLLMMVLNEILTRLFGVASGYSLHPSVHSSHEAGRGPWAFRALGWMFAGQGMLLLGISALLGA